MEPPASPPREQLQAHGNGTNSVLQTPIFDPSVEVTRSDIAAQEHAQAPI